MTKNEYNRWYRHTPKGRYVSAKNHAKRRNIPWKFTFEEWFTVWLDSGHWEERGPNGYCMCRIGDVGAYSKDNVYIASHSINKRDAFFNNKTYKLPPPTLKLKPKDYQEILCRVDTRNEPKKLANQFNMSIQTIYYIKYHKERYSIL